MDDTSVPKETILFHQLVLSFHTTAWHQLGKVKNPISGKVERDLEGASLTIDMLDMIKNKTKGNLSEEESKFLERLISELKLNYIEELKRSEETSKEEKKDKSEENSEEDKEEHRDS